MAFGFEILLNFTFGLIVIFDCQKVNLSKDDLEYSLFMIWIKSNGLKIYNKASKFVLG
jgi:hypothetical protein